MSLQPPQYNQKLGTPAVLDRQLLSEIFDAGVAKATDLLVTSTGGSRSVSIAAGACYVPSTQGSGYQGTYRTYNDAALTRTHDAATTFPRLDQIVMRVYDSTTLGSGSLDLADIEIVKGTEANGATALNRTGAVADGSLPANVVRLADVLVPVGASPVIPSANIIDRRPRAGLKAAGSVPIGTCVPYVMATEPTDGSWSLADGGLIDKTVYDKFFAGASHAYNGGVDPGSNKVRKPDKRGRGSVGADSMGASAASGTAGAAGRLTTAKSHPNARGQNGGTETHPIAVTELPSHDHGGSTLQPTGGSSAVNHNHTFQAVALTGGSGTEAFQGGSPNRNDIGMLSGGGALATHVHGISSQGGGQEHNNMHNYEVDLWIVRIA